MMTSIMITTTSIRQTITIGPIIIIIIIIMLFKFSL
jgi:hypothetical protein